ncbi:MAG: hypothetical protein ACYSO0_00800 [Planctomycetota bacterium]|jgi:hypothetical protein
MSNFEVNQTVWGRVCGMFQIDGFARIGCIEHALVKELNPSTGERGPHPTMMMPVDALRDTPPFKGEIIADEVLDIIRPFVEAKKYNPNNSESIMTTRTMSVKAIDIALLNKLFEKLGGEL